MAVSHRGRNLPEQIDTRAIYVSGHTACPYCAHHDRKWNRRRRGRAQCFVYHTRGIIPSCPNTHLRHKLMRGQQLRCVLIALQNMVFSGGYSHTHRTTAMCYNHFQHNQRHPMNKPVERAVLSPNDFLSPCVARR